MWTHRRPARERDKKLSIREGAGKRAGRVKERRRVKREAYIKRAHYERKGEKDEEERRVSE